VPTPAAPVPASTPAAPVTALSEDQVAATFHEAIGFFCQQPRTPDQIIGRFAPQGAVAAGGNLLHDGQPFYITSEVVTTLNTFQPATQVVWWLNPKAPGTVSEAHVVPEVTARIVNYRSFVARYRLPPATGSEQSTALSDIQHAHQLACGGSSLKVVINEIVWKGQYVGKIGELAFYWQ
jgi:hypothetical protein